MVRYFFLYIMQKKGDTLAITERVSRMKHKTQEHINFIPAAKVLKIHEMSKKIPDFVKSTLQNDKICI